MRYEFTRIYFLIIYCSLWFFGTLSLSALDTETALKEALDIANRGQSEQAIVKLEELKRSVPGDARICLSLGLLYQSTDQYDQAIQELERSNGLSPSLQASYALALLYESKWLKMDSETWKNKAIDAWDKTFRLAPAGSSNRDTAERHLKNLRNNG